MAAMTVSVPSTASRLGVLDRYGVVASIGCAVHCMVAPLLLLAAPALGGLWVHPATHLAIAAFVLPVAAVALHHGVRRHGRAWIGVLGAAGMLLVAVGVVLPWLVPSGVHAAHGACTDCCPSVHVDAENGAWSVRIPPASIVTLLGGVALVAAHVANLRHRCCATPD